MIRTAVELLLCAGSILLLVPGIVLLLETLAALLPAPSAPDLPSIPLSRVRVLIPAHDEALQIEETVRGLARETGESERILVVADNCSDETAALAASSGAQVVERDDPSSVGKGFAISFGMQQLESDPPDVVILVDADCRVSPGGVSTLARIAAATNRPVQAEYLLAAPKDPGPLTLVNGLAVLLRNQVRPRGLRRLGLPCLLTGSGMAFPWTVLRSAPDLGANLVEDMVLGIELALAGHAPLLCPEVQISSELPTDRGAGLRQRKRWEHGHIHTLVTYGPRLIAAGIARGKASLVGLGLDLMVPPLAFLVMLQTVMWALAATAWAIGIASLTPVALSSAGIIAVSAAVGVAWIGFGRRTLPLRYAFFLPLYFLWKIPLYLALAVRGKQAKWERTSRRHEGGG